MTENIFLLDLGSAFTKIGLASQSVPPLITPSAYGLPRIESVISTQSTESTDDRPRTQILHGDDLDAHTGAISREDLFPYSQPKDSTQIFTFLQYLFQKISLPTKNTGLVLALSPEWPNDYVYTLQSHLFQEYDFSS